VKDKKGGIDILTEVIFGAISLAFIIGLSFYFSGLIIAQAEATVTAVNMDSTCINNLNSLMNIDDFDFTDGNKVSTYITKSSDLQDSLEEINDVLSKMISNNYTLSLYPSENCLELKEDCEERDGPSANVAKGILSREEYAIKNQESCRYVIPKICPTSSTYETCLKVMEFKIQG